MFGPAIILAFGLSGCALASPDDFPTSPALDAALGNVFPTYATGESIDERAGRARALSEGQPAQVVLTRDGEGEIVSHVPEGQRPPGISVVVSVNVANADLIIKGIPLQRRSLPIADRTFLYSQYTVRVAEVLSPNAPIFPGETILVARPGGTLMVGDVCVRAIDADLPLFEPDRPYYFILRQIPGTTAYRALGAGTFAIEDGTVIRASEAGKGPKPQSEESFRAEIRRSIAYRHWPAEHR